MALTRPENNYRKDFSLMDNTLLRCWSDLSNLYFNSFDKYSTE
jgi:hypothetical protein